MMQLLTAHTSFAALTLERCWSQYGSFAKLWVILNRKVQNSVDHVQASNTKWASTAAATPAGADGTRRPN